MGSLARVADRLFRDDFWNNSLYLPRFPATTTLDKWRPSCDVTEKKDSYVITAELPGAKKEDIKLHMKGNLVTIEGSIREEKVQDEDKKHFSERFFGEFSRTFSMPDDADLDSIRAEHKDGVLNVCFNKKKAARDEAKRIEIL